MSMAAAAGIGALGSLGGAMYGANAAEKGSKAWMDLAEQSSINAREEIGKMQDINLPEWAYNPQEFGYSAGPTAINYSMAPELIGQGVNIDPTTRNAQMMAMEQLKGRAEGGLTAADKYNFMINQQLANEQSQGQIGAINERMQRQGMGGSNLDAVLSAQAAQANTRDLALSQALQAASGADMRLQATQAQGAMAGDIRNQDYAQAKTNADIMNEFAKINSQRQMDINNQNTKMANDMAWQNHDARMKTNAANVEAANQANLARNYHNIDRSQLSQQSARDKQQLMAQAYRQDIPMQVAGGAAASNKGQWLGGMIGQGVTAGANIYANSQKPTASTGDTINYNYGS